MGVWGWLQLWGEMKLHLMRRWRMCRLVQLQGSCCGPGG